MSIIVSSLLTLMPLIAQAVPDPHTTTLSWIISNGVAGLALVACGLLVRALKLLYDEKVLLERDYREKLEALDNRYQDKVDELNKEFREKAEELLKQQVALAEKYGESQREVLRVLKMIEKQGEGWDNSLDRR